LVPAIGHHAVGLDGVVKLLFVIARLKLLLLVVVVVLASVTGTVDIDHGDIVVLIGDERAENVVGGLSQLVSQIDRSGGDGFCTSTRTVSLTWILVEHGSPAVMEDIA
jgi:hypothetical protein